MLRVLWSVFMPDSAEVVRVDIVNRHLSSTWSWSEDKTDQRSIVSVNRK